MGWLASIRSPADLRRIPRDALPDVASELRQELIRLGARRGGHFAGSLGAVELTIGLHYVFETPRDRLVWDVGHQAYGHKALTGRLEALERIKQEGGPSGFLRRCESPYDAFGAGHAGTSVSAGLGLAEGLRRDGRSARVVAVIGDGGATAGLAFEGLNHAGYLGRDLRVVFNDNGYSIAPNVGGLSRAASPRGYFETLGWRYLGPVDGHRLDELLPALEALRDAAGPTVLHVRTRKGCGYPPAEADPFHWHATAPFDPASGERAGTRRPVPTWTEAFAAALIRMMERDPRVVAITAAMPDGTGLERVARHFPDRVYDVGIAEQHAVTFAAGLAAEGQRPVCAIYSTFLQRGFDSVVHDVALQGLPVVFALDRAGFVGPDGPTHHGLFDLAYLRIVPGLAVAAPSDENDLQHLLATALASERPFAIRYPRGAARGVALDPEPQPLPLGRGRTLREGPDVALVGIGSTLSLLTETAAQLAERGIEPTLIDARFVKPLDRELLVGAARRCRLVVTAEEHVLSGGFGSAVLELLAEAAPGVRVLRFGVGDRFVEHASLEAQRRAERLDPEAIERAVIAELGPRRSLRSDRGARVPRRRAGRGH